MSNNQRHLKTVYREQSMPFTYTYQLPYSVRKDICDLLDADQSWQDLGGKYMGLDSTQLALIGQAYKKNSSPANELLGKLDTGNFRIADLYFYLHQMRHCRALEVLKAFANDNSFGYPPTTNLATSNNNQTLTESSHIRETMMSGTLNTPTPSFNEALWPQAIMNLQEETSNSQHSLLQPAVCYPSLKQTNEPSNCHRSRAPTQMVTSRDNQQLQHDRSQVKLKKELESRDPGEEIVRLACESNRKRTSISDQEVVNQLRLCLQIKYNELKQASDDFGDANILGNGGFASVYRGNWKGTDVAIKRLKCNLMDQALNELTMLNSYRIDNILPIYGISIDGPEACLVYQFMSNGSLEDRLSCKKGTAPLSWQQRALIGEGVAKGLYYLHTLREKPLVHGDVKSANVLLDSQFVPKLGDFGLARQVFIDKNTQTDKCTHCTVSSIRGTSVYLPYEYLRQNILSPAVDVYSYGIVLLEMATGRRAFDGKRLLLEIVEEGTRSLANGNIDYSLKDSRLVNDTETDLQIWYELLIGLGINCAHRTKKKRPDMGQVLSKFAEFKGSSIGSSSLHSDGSTLKADFSSMGQHQPQQPDYRLAGQGVSRTLMSVDEGRELDITNDQQEPHLNNWRPGGVQNQPAHDLDMLIPLVTELGISKNLDSKVEKAYS